MSVSIEIENKSFRETQKQFKKLSKEAPEQTFKAVMQIAYDVKRIAQLKIKEDNHIDTSRLRNSIFVQAYDKRISNTSNNRRIYTDNEGNNYDASLDVNIKKDEVAIGTNVVYAQFIETLDSFMYYAAKTVNFKKFLNAIKI